MLVLRSSPTSPFGRKVKIAADVLGLTDRIQVVKADTADPNEILREQNPLGKIPVLVLEDNSTLYDSRVIVEYLDMLAGGGRILPVGLNRFDVLRLQALADGLSEAAVIQIYEARFHTDEQRSSSWLSHQVGKVDRALTWLERNLAPFEGFPDIGQITVACSLGYLDLRFNGDWRRSHPGLVGWHDAFAAAIPSFERTRPPAA